jgi:hypothetical protein
MSRREINKLFEVAMQKAKSAQQEMRASRNFMAAAREEMKAWSRFD